VKTDSKSDLYRQLPSVDELIRASELADLVAREGRKPVTDAARSVLDHLRTEINSGRLDSQALNAAVEQIANTVERQLHESTGFSLRPVINATGVILHTNLGRAPLSDAVIDHIRTVAACYSNLEFELADGKRGERDVHVDRLFRQLLNRDSNGTTAAPQRSTPGVSTIVVNNNAAAVWLALNTLAAGGEVIVSRGELVEIGGSFRIPDVMAQSNGILREVGTTNRTRISDYAQAVNNNTRLLLRVHRSNFQITGFTEQPALEELVALAGAQGIPLVEDLGSGALLDLSSLEIAGESGVSHSVRAGVHVVTYSGDKLLGGPQAGMLTGRADLISRMRANSLFRALRVDKLTYAALEATLLAYVKQDYEAIPIVRMMLLSKDAIGQRAGTVARSLAASNLAIDVIDGESVIGGGAAPSAVLPTSLIAVTVKGLSADELLARLRTTDPPIVARVSDDRVVFDLRTVLSAQDALIGAALRTIAESHP
jgi:L-seryl-tRNA(Ser) seleniumtransferase